MDVADAAQNLPRSASDERAAGLPSSRDARSLFAVALLGVIVAALTWRLGDAGLGWLSADTVCVAALLAGVGGGRPGGAAWGLGAASIALAGATCWRASDWSVAVAFPASIAALVAAGLACSRRVHASRLSDVPPASIDALRALPGGIADAARLAPRAVGPSARGHAVGVLRGLLIGAPVATAFGLLLAADGAFRHALARAAGRGGDGADLALWTLATTVGFLVVRSILRRLEPAPRDDDGDASIALGPYRLEGDAFLAPASPGLAPRLRPLTWGVAIAPVAALFGVFVFANWGSLFADHAQVRGTTTYAAYVHEGFTQVTVAALLAVAAVVVGHALLRPRGRPAPGAVPGGKALAVVELTLLGLVGVTLASCAHRLALYEEAYGYTYLRLAVWWMQLGIAGLLTTTAARCVARTWGGWGSALGWSALAFAVFAGWFDADGWIASRNVARARAGAQLDVAYLASLSEDARPVLSSLAVSFPSAAEEARAAWDVQARVHRGRGWRAMRGLGAR